MRLEAPCAEQSALQNDLATLLCERAACRHEDDVAVGVRRDAVRRLSDLEGSAREKRGEEPELVHGWGSTASTSSSKRPDDVSIVGEHLDDRRPHSAAQAQALSDKTSREDQCSGRRHFAQWGAVKVPDGIADSHQGARRRDVNSCFVRDHLDLGFDGREAEFDCDEALPGRLLHILQDALIPRVVGHHQLKTLCRRQCGGEPVDGELAAVIGQRVDDDRGVLARLDDLVEIADGPQRTARVNGPSTHTVSPPLSRNRPTRSADVMSS